MNSINIFEHRIYSFYIHLLLTSHQPSHFIIQFNAARPSEKCQNLSVSLSGSRPPKLSVSTYINPKRSNGLVVMETDGLGGQEPDNKTDNFGRHFPI